MIARRKSRILCVQALYAWDIRGQVLDTELLSFTWSPLAARDGQGEDAFWYARQILTGTLDHVEEIDVRIARSLKNREFSRVHKLDLAIIRMSVYCLLWQPDMERSIVIDEAIHISREYSEASSYRFINGVLDSIRP